MGHILLFWLVNAVAVYLTANILSGIHINSFGAALSVALVLGLINAIVKPLFILFSIPVILLSMGLFLLVINALLLQLSATVLYPDSPLTASGGLLLAQSASAAFHG